MIAPRDADDEPRVFAPSLELARLAQSFKAPLLSPELSAVFSTAQRAGRVAFPATVGLAASVGRLPALSALANTQHMMRMARVGVPDVASLSMRAAAIAGLRIPAVDRLSVALPRVTYPDGVFRALAIPTPSLFLNQALFDVIGGRMATALRNLPALTEWWGLFASGRMEAAFTAVGIAPSLTMGMRLIRSVIHWHEAGVTPERIGADVLAYYDADDCAELATVVDRLCASPDMAGREPIIQQAYANHRHGWDAGTALMLIPMVEGILRPAIHQMDKTITRLTHNNTQTVRIGPVAARDRGG